jgi:glycosyltransferase involved in cell wall biosynthesis
MARLAIDATAVAPGAKGIGRVARGTVEALAAREVDVVALVQEGAALRAPRQVVRARPAVLWEQLGLRRAAGEHDAVLTFTERLPVGARGRFVVWLYELPHRRLERSRGLYQRGSDLVTRALWKRSLRTAWRVAAGSKATAAGIERALPELRGRVAVVYPGLDPQFAPGPGRDGGRYVLHLGSTDPRDNTGAALAAFARAKTAEPVRLLVAGGVRGPAQDGVEFLGRVSDEELVRLYRGAAAYLDTSLFEGFGYQALEALACGTPYVGSNATSLPEVVGDAGLLVEPTDVEALAAALVRVFDEPGLAEKLRGRGLERARRFTWDRTVDALLALVEEDA